MTMWQRTLSIYVDVPEEWLIEDDEVLTDDNAVASRAWAELRDEVKRALKLIYERHGKPRHPIPTFDVDWEDTPQKEAAS